MIREFKQYINESVYIDKFTQLYDISPIGLKSEIEKSKTIEQNPYWHIEGVVFIHIKTVTNRLENQYHDINLTLSGFFHDLGKNETTEFNDKKGSWSSPNHEESSLVTIDKYKDWIIKLGGDLDLIKYIVANHMRYKVIDEMRISEQIKFLENDNFHYIQKFSSADYGGIDKHCKPIEKHTYLLNKIVDYKEKQIKNRKIADKFNGKMIMDKYPQLRGKDLGDAIYKFKNNFGDFEEYALSSSSDKIMGDFDVFIKNK